MLTGFGVSVILVIGTGRGQHGAYSCDVSWLVKNGSSVPSELDQMTAFADRDVKSWNGTPVRAGVKRKRLLFKGRPIKGKLQMPRTLLSSQVVPFREFQD
jgi:hypothetical protein